MEMFHFLGNISTNSAQILFSLFGGLCCLIPLAMGMTSELLEDSQLRHAMSSQANRDSAVASLSISVPIVMDLATEIFFSSSLLSERNKMHTRALLNPLERISFVVGTALIPMTAFLSSETPNLGYIYLCLTRCQFMLVGGAVMTSLCRYNEKTWTVRKTYFVLTLNFLANVTGVFGYSNPSITAFTGAASTLTVVIVFYLSTKWLYKVIPTLLESSRCLSKDEFNESLENATPPESSNSLLFPVMYLITTIVSVVLLIAESALIPKIGDYNSRALFNHNLAFVLYLVLIVYISTRMMKNEVVQGLNEHVLALHFLMKPFFMSQYALIESKKMYVRYISHELRTPLNSAFLGLKLVCDGLKVSGGDGRDYETLMDVQSACKTAVEILNDLLCFDKLESGILEMHKHDVPVIPFVEDCVNMFASQAREGGVDMSIVVHDASLSDMTNNPAKSLLMCDTVCIDKFKMDQVLRNLISNALKFTPRGGSVTVCASFVPNADQSTSAPPLLIAPMVCPRTGVLHKLYEYLAKLSRIRQPRRWNPKVHTHTPNVRSSGSGGRRRKHGGGKGRGAALRERRYSNTNNSFYISNESNEMVSNYYRQRNISSRNNDASLNFSANSSMKKSQAGNTTASGSANPLDKNVSGVTIYGKLRIVVTDTGAGICEEDQRRLFKEIVQFNPEVLQAGGGSGLGLWITSSIIKMHSGTISVYSAGPGTGSTFTVEVDMERWVSRAPQQTIAAHNSPVGPVFPLRGGRSPADVKDRSMRSNDSSVFESLEGRYADIEVDDTRSGRTMPMTMPVFPAIPDNVRAAVKLFKSPLRVEAKGQVYPFIGDPVKEMQAKTELEDSEHEVVYDVLVVDDSSLNRKLLCKVLRNAGYTTTEAIDGLTAVEKVKVKMASEIESKIEYDAILMDFVMPNMDGPTATKTIRALGYKGPIFGLTGNALDSDVCHFLDHGADAVLPKPFDFKLFKHLMKKGNESMV